MPTPDLLDSDIAVIDDELRKWEQLKPDNEKRLTCICLGVMEIAFVAITLWGFSLVIHKSFVEIAIAITSETLVCCVAVWFLSALRNEIRRSDES